jgi:hypothetical protein
VDNETIIEENDRQEIENLYRKKILNVFAIRSSGGVYNDVRWEPRADPSNPRPLLIHSGNLLHSIRNADVQWDGQDDFAVEVEKRHYKGKDITTRDVLLYHQHGTENMPARPVLTELEKNDIEDIRRLIDRKTKRREERFYKRWYDAFVKSISFFWR